jgi:hypothetical protein
MVGGSLRVLRLLPPLKLVTKIQIHRNEKKINQKFVWLKLASINISRCTVLDCAPFLVVPFLFDIERN